MAMHATETAAGGQLDMRNDCAIASVVSIFYDPALGLCEIERIIVTVGYHFVK